MELKKIISQHPQVLNNVAMFKGILLDTYNQPENKGKINLILNAYEIHITDEIAQNDLDDVFVERMKKKLVSTYSVTDNSAEWAIKTWCSEYGNGMLGKNILFADTDIDFEDEPELSNESKQSAPASPLIKRVYLFLEDGDFKQADEYCERILDSDPECAEAYLCKLMAELRVCKKEDLKNCDLPFDDSNNYKKALRFADATLSQKLQNCIESINNRNLSIAYDEAVQVMQSATTESGYKVAANKFNAISSFMDSKQLATECLAKAESIRMHSIENMYADAVKLIESIKTVNDLDKVVTMLSEIEFYSDSRELINNLSMQKSKYNGYISELVNLLKKSEENEKKKNQLSREVSSLTNNQNSLFAKQGTLPDKLKRLEEIKHAISGKTSKKNSLQDELSSLGIFAGKRKKELNQEIQDISRNIDSLARDRRLLEDQIGSHDSVDKLKREIEDVQKKLLSTQKQLDDFIAKNSTDGLLNCLGDDLVGRMVKESFRKMKLDDGAIYEGQTKDNKPCGYGKAVWSNGNTYNGEWLNGIKSGHGVFYKKTDGFVADCTWVKDEMHGRGTWKLPDGTKYEGQLSNGQMHGQGKLTTPDGSYYVGGFLNGKMHGHGYEYDKYGSLKREIWRDSTTGNSRWTNI